MDRRWSWSWTDRIDAGFGLIAVAVLSTRILLGTWTIPLRTAWVALTLLYGVWLWWAAPRIWRLVALIVVSAAFLGVDIARDERPFEELAEDPPLLAALAVAMLAYSRRLGAANNRLAGLLERQRQFICDASHELRTPITVALGHTQLINRTVDDPEVAEDANLVVEELQRLGRLADRLVLLASLEDPGALCRQRVDLADLAREGLRRWRSTPRSWLASALQPAPVDADAEALTVALDALIENAVHATTPEQVIEVSVATVGRMARLTVTDSGQGLPDQRLDGLFEPFARGDQARVRDHDRFGLGLALVGTVVQAHDGQVQASRRPQGGSTFEVWLPLA
jgi:two-component system OmpR family sensor kinase